MRRLLVPMLFVSLFFMKPAMAAEGHEHQHDHSAGGDKEITVRGEIVDAFCYLSMGLKGPSHKQCAIDCAKAGVPVGIVEEGTGKVYILSSNQDKTALPDSVISKMGETVNIKGDYYSEGGAQFIAVESVF